MSHIVALIHTVSPLLPVFSQLGSEILPSVRLLHILDELLLERVKQRGHLDREDSNRLFEHVRIAQQVGAAAVLVTCSAVSPSVDGVRERARIPVLKIDEAMIERAVSLGTRIGVIATNPPTLGPTCEALAVEGERVGRRVQTTTALVDGAMTALLQGDGASHDRLVADAIERLWPEVDVIVLAQASTARALEAIPVSERKIPILASPREALEQVRRLLTQEAVPGRTL